MAVEDISLETKKRNGRLRWSYKATHEGELGILSKKYPCAVLENGHRVMTQEVMFNAFERPARGSMEGRGYDIDGVKSPSFIDAKNLKPYVDQLTMEERKTLKPIVFISKSGAEIKGCRAEAIPVICDVYLRARDDNALTKGQLRIASVADKIIRSLAKTGILALIDEATGYQEQRPRNALQEYLNKMLSQELAEWTKTFPDEYYENIYKLNNWAWYSGKKKYYRCVGIFTNDIIYSRLGYGLLEELKKRTLKTDAGNPVNKLHQWLSTETGKRKLSEHIHMVIGLQKVALANGFRWKKFIDMLNIAAPIKEKICDIKE